MLIDTSDVDMMSNGAPEPHVANLEYLRRLHEKTFEWYKIADSKGQLLLTLNGVFITVVSTTIFDRPQDLAGRLAAAGVAGLVTALFSAICVAGSVLSAVLCLYSRLSDARLSRLTGQDLGVDPNDPSTFKPAIAGWFGFIASIAGAARREEGAVAPSHMQDYLHGLDDNAEREMLASQVVALSHNVLIKHRWVDRGWLLAGAALIGLIGFGLAYVTGAR